MILPDGPAAPGPEREPRVPWEDPETGFPGSLVATFLASVTVPVRLFRAVDPGVPFVRPLLYYLVLSVASALFSTLWGMTGSGPALPPELTEALGYDLMGDGGGGWHLLDFFLSPFVALLALGVSMVVVHPFIRLFTESRRPISETGRVFCYAAGPGVLTIVPWVGGIAAAVGSLVLVVIGLRERHDTTTGRALAAVLVPGVALAFLATALVLFSLAVMGSLGEFPVL